MQKGFFITFEGGEGAGKTTIIHFVKEYLLEKGYEVITTREPGGIDIAEQIRSIILDTANKQMEGRTEALLYAAARRQHLVEKVIPALNQGKIVLCDRFIDSSLAYQGFARGIGMEEILVVNQFAIGGYMPHLTIYLDLDPEVGLARINANKDREVNRLDLEGLEFHHTVRRGYKELVHSYPQRIVEINAEPELEDVRVEVLSILKQRLLHI